MQFFLFIIASVAAKAAFPPGRIVGGVEVSPKYKYPFLTSLQYNDEHICGGTWYSGNTVISAAHCVVGPEAGWTASVHRHDLGARAADEQGLAFNVTSRIPHPEYDDYTSANDVSIWKVANEATAPIIALDTTHISDIEDTLLTVIGWGATSEGADGSTALLEVRVPITSTEQCLNAYQRLGIDTKTQFCAGYPEGGKDSCQGDSGGPIVVASGSSYTLVGVVSWGQGCARKGLPGVYTRTYAVADFIAKNI